MAMKSLTSRKFRVSQCSILLPDDLHREKMKTLSSVNALLLVARNQSTTFAESQSSPYPFPSSPSKTPLFIATRNFNYQARSLGASSPLFLINTNAILSAFQFPHVYGDRVLRIEDYIKAGLSSRTCYLQCPSRLPPFVPPQTGALVCDPRTVMAPFTISPESLRKRRTSPRGAKLPALEQLVIPLAVNAGFGQCQVRFAQRRSHGGDAERGGGRRIRRRGRGHRIRPSVIRIAPVHARLPTTTADFGNNPRWTVRYRDWEFGMVLKN